MEGKLTMKVGNARPAKIESVAVSIDKEVVRKAAKIATTIIWQKYGVAMGVSRDDIDGVNVVSLTAALMKAIDPEANVPTGVLVPVYFDSMIRGLRTKIGRTVVISQLDQSEVVVPDNYRETVTMMKAVGIGFGRPHAPSIDHSSTLTLGKETIDGVVSITGNLGEVVIEDMIRRAFLQVESRSADTIARLTGELSLNYGELDTLVEDYYIAQVRVSLT